ncbi:MAG: hypothetical protein RLY16_1849 [Bacteroidota bacterium]
MKDRLRLPLLFSLFVLVFVAFLPKANAQWYDPEKVNKKAAEIYGQAYEQAQEGNYQLAIQLVNKSITYDAKFVDAYLTRAGIYANEKKYDSSVIDFETALQLDSIYAESYRLPYSISLAGLGKFEEALKAITQFMANPQLNQQSIRAGKYRKAVYEFAVNYQQQHPSGSYEFKPTNMGDSVNSEFSEYYPSLTIDGKQLIFTRRIKDDEDFFESSRDAQGWKGNHPLTGKVNTNFNEGAQNISQDGNWIVFTGCNYPEGMGSCDLYISYRTNNGWTEAVNLGAVVNSEYWESAPSLSPDKQHLYFSSNRPGGYGGKDIWVSHRNEKGKWGTPQNLGPIVNTNQDESCPFMHADHQTLFFNSNGHMGYGSTDLYFTRQSGDSAWTAPMNLGYPINTIDDEGSLIVSADATTAFYASERSDSRGALDLYSFELRPDMRPSPTRWVQGRVYDIKTGKGLPSSVELTDMNTRKLVSRVATDEDGNYLTTLPVGHQYVFNVNRRGYLFFSSNYTLSNNNNDSFFTADIPLQPIEPGAAIVLKNVFFETNKTVLSAASQIELNSVIQLMNDNPQLKILLTGHTDNVGKASDNLLLSEGRAKAVIQYLLSSGTISKERLTAKGMGATKPISDNTTEEGKAKNRRTELTVISN